MGLSDDFVIPTNTNEAIHLAGDGVAVPVVEHLSKSIFEPILSSRPVLLRRQEFKRPAFA
jgi:DNA (cytosine-5)-methyltransferase 1